jgi:7-cyano-7-deazaguanine synthase
LSIVPLVSGGMDSTLMSIMIKEEGILTYPLFINYGQLCGDIEWDTCIKLHLKYNLPKPEYMELSGFGKLISSGLTDSRKNLYDDAFLPGRNLLFLLAGASYAFQTKSNSVAIGLLTDEYHLFPDQTKEFIKKAESLITIAMGSSIKVLAPLMNFNKSDVIKLSNTKGISGTYSCHAGTNPPCGKCVSCLEVVNALKKED